MKVLAHIPHDTAPSNATPTDRPRHIYAQAEAHRNAFKAIHLWIEFLKKFIYRKETLHPDDWLVPSVNWATGKLAGPGFLQNETVNKILRQVVVLAGLVEAGSPALQSWTSHGIRRGCIQDAFSGAIEKRWTLAQCRWWGGWAVGEHVCQQLLSLIGHY